MMKHEADWFADMPQLPFTIGKSPSDWPHNNIIRELVS